MKSQDRIRQAKKLFFPKTENKFEISKKAKKVKLSRLKVTLKQVENND